MTDNKNNLMGLNLSVNSELIAEAVKETIIASIAEGLGNKEAIIHEFVSSVLTDRVLVDDGGKPIGYRDEKTCSRLEFVMRKAIIDITKDELTNMIEEQKPVLRDLIRKEFLKQNVQEGLVDMFMKSMRDSITAPYRTKVDVNFIRDYD